MKKRASAAVFSFPRWTARLVAVLALTGLLLGCGASTTMATRAAPAPQQGSPVASVALGVVAIGEVEIAHPSARLVYREDVVRDMMASALMRSQYFGVIDWRRLDAVIFRRNLEWSDLMEDSEQREAIRDIVLNDYFLVVTVSSYGEHLEYGASALSRNKTQVGTVQLEFLLKDALTNEIVTSAQVQSEARRTMTQTLGFGAGGGSDPTLATNALASALDRGIQEIIASLQSVNAAAGAR